MSLYIATVSILIPILFYNIYNYTGIIKRQSTSNDVNGPGVIAGIAVTLLLIITITIVVVIIVIIRLDVGL